MMLPPCVCSDVALVLLGLGFPLVKQGSRRYDNELRKEAAAMKKQPAARAADSRV